VSPARGSKPVKIFLDISVNLGPFILYKPFVHHYLENFLPQKIHENSSIGSYRYRDNFSPFLMILKIVKLE
jgi:hypothetical protein